MNEITYHVPEMHCGACEQSIRKAVEPVAGVQDLHVNLDRREVTVHFDPGQTSLLAIKERIERAGFDVG
jgi:copper chaperone CopZ